MLKVDDGWMSIEREHFDKIKFDKIKFQKSWHQSIDANKEFGGNIQYS